MGFKLSTGTQVELETLPPREDVPPPQKRLRRFVLLLFVILAVVAVLAAIGWRFRPHRTAAQPEIAVVRRGDFSRTLRVNGTVEAVQFLSISAPRLAGSGGSLVITKLVPNGKFVRKGDLLVEFDSQSQVKEALDREAEYKGLLQQILKKKADQAAQLASDKTELAAAEHTLQKARLELRKNEVISQIDAEKNQESLEEAKATLQQLQQTFELKRRAAQAELRTLEIQRDRAMQAMQHATENSKKVAVRAPLDGVVVLSASWRSGQMSEPQEGDQVYPGRPLLKLVNPSSMQVRARVNQTDIDLLSKGQPARITLDAYPNIAYTGQAADLATVGQTSSMNSKVRYYTSLFSIAGSHPQLMPDLSAAVDVELERRPGVLLVARDTLVRASGGWLVYRKMGGSTQKVPVSVAALSDTEAVIQSGVSEGAQLLRHPLNNEGRP